jgi:hypothetical protein
MVYGEQDSCLVIIFLNVHLVDHIVLLPAWVILNKQRNVTSFRIILSKSLTQKKELHFNLKNAHNLVSIKMCIVFMVSCSLLQSDTFQEDLFPDTAAPTPAISARDWINGRNCNPILMSMNTGQEILT